MAVQGFTSLALLVEEQSRLDAVYKRIERNIRLSIWEESMDKYQNILKSLVKVNRYDQQVWNKIENHIMNNLAFEYEVSQMLEILYCFSKYKHGSHRFYEAMQHIIFKGHLFNHNYFLQQLNYLNYDGAVLSHLVATYATVYLNHPYFTSSPDFHLLLVSHLVHPRTHYTLS